MGLFDFKKKKPEPTEEATEKEKSSTVAKFEKRLADNTKKGNWGELINHEDPEMKDFVKDIEAHKGVVKRGNVTAVTPRLPRRFTQLVEMLAPNSGGGLPPAAMAKAARQYVQILHASGEDVSAFLADCPDVEEIIADMETLSPVEWSAKYALPLFIGFAVQTCLTIHMTRHQKVFDEIQEAVSNSESEDDSEE